MTPITVVVPVGPDPAYLKYLPECLESILMQMELGDCIVVVDDMAHLLDNEEFVSLLDRHPEIIYQDNDWLYGCAISWSRGVALSPNEWCILMGSDDALLQGCLDACREVISSNPDPLGYYNLTILTDTGEKHDVFNNAAMVSRSLWKHTGGFPLSASVGAPDALLISIMLRNMPEHLHQLKQGTPFYWCRTGDYQDTKKQAGPFNWEVIRIRDIETARWESPAWAQK